METLGVTESSYPVTPAGAPKTETKLFLDGFSVSRGRLLGSWMDLGHYSLDPDALTSGVLVTMEGPRLPS